MTELTDKSKLHTFSIGFEGKYDETKYMEVVKDAFGTNHHHQYFTEKEFEALFDHIYHYYDEPFGDFSNFPTFEVSKLARKYVTVSLSGDGGDEIFGGYPFHQVAARLELIKILPKWARKVAFAIWPKRKDMSFVGQVHEGLRLSFVPEQKFFAEIGSEVLYRSETFKKWSEQKMKEMLEVCRGNFVEAAIKYDLFYQTLADNYLVKTDRASMANSLEIRSPFLDVRFVEYSAKIPTKWKVSAFKTKILMRDIIKGLVPEVIRTRGKQGFTPPLIEWAKKEKYQTIIKNALEELHDKKIIGDDWYDFYKSKVMVSDNKVFDQCKIRILLLWKWWEAWH
jgi:asparagine synthase (glutamine-hydrolysing)